MLDFLRVTVDDKANGQGRSEASDAGEAGNKLVVAAANSSLRLTLLAVNDSSSSNALTSLCFSERLEVGVRSWLKSWVSLANRSGLRFFRGDGFDGSWWVGVGKCFRLEDSTETFIADGT